MIKDIGVLGEYKVSIYSDDIYSIQEYNNIYIKENNIYIKINLVITRKLEKQDNCRYIFRWR